MEWMQSLSLATKENFMAKRYMDDILCFYNKSDDWDYKAFISDFERSECYMSPLHLEDANQHTFLETSFSINPGTIDQKQKNENDPFYCWKFTHFRSHMAYKQKRAVLITALKKAYDLASSPEMIIYGALKKISEFERLGYPNAMIRFVCARLAIEMEEPLWFYIRKRTTLNPPLCP